MKKIDIKPCRITYLPQTFQYPGKTEMNIFAKTKQKYICSANILCLEEWRNCIENMNKKYLKFRQL